MPALSPLLLILVALIAGAWLGAAVWATRRALRAAEAAETTVGDSARLAALLDAGPDDGVRILALHRPHIGAVDHGELEVGAAMPHREGCGLEQA